MVYNPSVRVYLHGHLLNQVHRDMLIKVFFKVKLGLAFFPVAEKLHRH